MRQELINVIIWYRNCVPMNSQKTAEQLIDNEYIPLINSKALDESENVIDNEDEKEEFFICDICDCGFGKEKEVLICDECFTALHKKL